MKKIITNAMTLHPYLYVATGGKAHVWVPKYLKKLLVFLNEQVFESSLVSAKEKNRRDVEYDRLDKH